MKLKQFYPNNFEIQLDIKHVVKDGNTDLVMHKTLPEIIRKLGWVVPEKLTETASISSQ
jgi:hypothetical protein